LPYFYNYLDFINMCAFSFLSDENAQIVFKSRQ